MARELPAAIIRLVDQAPYRRRRLGSNVRPMTRLKLWLRPVVFASSLLPLAGCVTLHAPLTRDSSYPADWPEVTSAGEECRGLNGTYLNSGEFAVADSKRSEALLTQILHLSTGAKRLSLAVHTTRLDRHGDATSSLVIVPDGDESARAELANCFCIRQTLTCTQINERYWSLPFVGMGGAQSNVYLSSAVDGSLVLRLQSYHADVVLGVPLFQKSEPWARFMVPRP